MRLILFSLFNILSCCYTVFSQSDLDYFYTKSIDTYGTYAVEFAPNATIPSSIQVKYRANGWTYVLADRNDLYDLLTSGAITKLYREPSVGPSLMNDSMRTTHFVNQVHQGLGLDFPFTGQGVIMGYVDDGLDVNHLDFKNSSGQTRVLRYWNQGQAAPHPRTPTKYGYGRVYTNVDINNNINVGQINQSSHGTTVTGAGSGNGLANGRNKGVAPDCNIIVVRTVFTLPSWSLTVAEGVDYIFSVADSLGMPAVVNLSVGTYLGSHDAKDPAGVYIDSLLNEKDGRIVVCAAGNSGSWPAYHVQKELSADTNFVWMIPNPAFTFGLPGVYFDLWADTTDIQNMHFAFGADAPGPVYRGNTTYKQVDFSIQTVQTETIFGINNDVIGSVIYQGQLVGSNYNLQAIIFTDSLDYMMRFLVTGAGKIDMWSSAQSPLNLSNFSTSIPDVNLFPEFAYYMMPDTLQSIVSSWTCSDQVITVGNTQNRKEYIDRQGNLFPVGGGTIPAGQLSATSSKGPNRQGNVKPEVVASGDMSLSARVLSVALTGDFYDIGNMHVRNGGTSMASPVVAGIAALYLEKCPKSNWLDFKNDLIAAAFEDNFTGNNLPNYAFGYGKAHALNTLLQTEFNPQITGNPALCLGETELEVPGTHIDMMIWNTTDTTNILTVTSTGSYHGLAVNNKGCKNFTDTLIVVNDVIPPTGTAPADTWVSCIASVPSPDVSLVSNLNDNCGIDEVIHLNDDLLNDGCIEYVERTYRITDVSNNFTDVVQIISILTGTEIGIVEDNMSVYLEHGCNGIFIEDGNCETKYLSIQANGNIIDFDDAIVTINHGIVDPYPAHVDYVETSGTGYYETTDGINTFRLSKIMYSIELAGQFTNNGGVLVRLYYNPNDFESMLDDVPPYGDIAQFGWFKSSLHNPTEVVDEMSAAAPLLASAVIINPVNSGTESGVTFVEFLVNEFSTFGYFASTQATPLPVTLSHFSAQCEAEEIKVTWTTTSEHQSSHFILEMSREGTIWQTMATVEAAGNSSQTQHYEIRVPQMSQEQYFRLQQVDFNGATTTYGPYFQSCDWTGNNWFIQENSNSDNLIISLNSTNITSSHQIHIVDLSGRILLDVPVTIHLGSNMISLDVSTFPAGAYIVRLNHQEGELAPLKFAVSR